MHLLFSMFFLCYQKLRARRCGLALCFESVVQPGGNNDNYHGKDIDDMFIRSRITIVYDFLLFWHQIVTKIFFCRKLSCHRVGQQACLAIRMWPQPWKLCEPSLSLLSFYFFCLFIFFRLAIRMWPQPWELCEPFFGPLETLFLKSPHIWKPSQVRIVIFFIFFYILKFCSKKYLLGIS